MPAYLPDPHVYRSPSNASWATSPSTQPCPPPPCRHRLLPLVCRRFGDLCYSPQLLPTAFDLNLHLDGQLIRVRSFAEWLVRRGAGRVQRLHLRLSLNMRNEAEGDGLDATATVEEDDQVGEEGSIAVSCVRSKSQGGKQGGGTENMWGASRHIPKCPTNCVPWLACLLTLVLMDHPALQHRCSLGAEGG